MWDEVYEQINRIEQLEENWDGYDASPVEPDVIELARKLVQFLQKLGERYPTDAYLMNNGEIAFEWQDDSGFIKRVFVHTKFGVFPIETSQMNSFPDGKLNFVKDESISKFCLENYE